MTFHQLFWGHSTYWLEKLDQNFWTLWNFDKTIRITDFKCDEGWWTARRLAMDYLYQHNPQGGGERHK